MNRFLILLMVTTFPVFAQIQLRTEEFAATSYRLTFENAGYGYSVDPSTKQLTFIGASNESFGGAPELPRRELFIAIPPGMAPSSSFRPTETAEIMNAIPKRGAIARRVNDTLVAYDAPDGLPVPAAPTASWYRFNGYLWVGTSYCMHFTLFPYRVNASSNSITELKRFILDIEIPAARRGAVRASADLPVNALIDNPRFGSTWQTNNAVFPTAATDSWIDYTAEYVKLGVIRDAVYRLSYADLQSYGVPVASLDPRKFKLYMAGKELPIHVYGQQDGTFDQSDAVEFVGRRNYGDTRYRQVPPFGSAYYEYLNLYSDTTIYWLQWSGANGKRIDTTVTVAAPPQDTIAYYDHLIHSETNQYLDYQLNPNPGGLVRREEPEIYENETWHEGNIAVGKRAINFGITKLVTNKPARSFMKMQHYSSSVEVTAHLVALTVNSGTKTYDSSAMNKYEQRVFSASFSSSLLFNGTNTVNINSYPTLNTVNLLIGDWYELEYPRQLNTTTDSLIFDYRSPVTSGVSRVIVTGITQPSMVLYRFNKLDSSCVKITNVTIKGDSLQFTDSVKAGTTYFLISAAKSSRPIFFYKKQFTNLRSTQRQADYIAITHPYFIPSTGAYLSFIEQTYGVSTAVVNVHDIYDEFNYGFFAPEPIRDFLKAAVTNWKTPKPKTVFLIGKATYDYYGYKTRFFGVPRLENFVPSFGSPVSDPWFTIWDSTGANVPMLSIGRLPAKNISEFQIYSLRHQKYVTKGYDDWNKQYIFFSGGASTSQSEITLSRNANEAVMNQFVTPPPIGGNAISFYKTIGPTTNFGPYTAEFYKKTVDQGSVFISYIGHSGTQTWDNSIADVTQLSNIRDRNPMVTDFGCSTAKHAEPNVFSFSEIFVVDPKGQAINYIGNSSLGFQSTAYSFPTTFYRTLMVDTTLSVGESHRLAKIAFMKQNGSTGSNRLFTLTNCIMGDPIVNLPIPKKPNLTVTNSIVSIVPEQPSESDDTITVRIPYLNLGMVPQDSMTVAVSSVYKGSTVLQHSLRIRIPSYADTITVRIPVGNRPGEHLLTVSLDAAGAQNEIYENDNVLNIPIAVASSTLRNTDFSSSLHQTNGTVTLLNPGISTGSETFSVAVSLTPDLSSAQTMTVPMDTFMTRYTFPSEYAGKRVWFRTKVDTASASGLTYSYVVGNRNNILFADPSAFQSLTLTNLAVKGDGLAIDTSSVAISAISAGANAGATAVVSRNGLNLTPASNLTGHHVAIFDSVTYALVYFARYNNVAGGATITNYEKLLDTLSTRFLLAVAVSNDGYSNLTAKLRTSYKAFGSRYIDSLTGPYSWSFIGRKGALPASVKESFSRLNGNIGRVQVDTVIRIPNNSGSFITPVVGPVAVWESMNSSFVVPSGGAITLGVIGVRADQGTDTLMKNIPVDTLISLAAIDAAIHPSLRIFGSLTAGAQKESPSLPSLSLQYVQRTEVGTNYQAFWSSLASGPANGLAVAVSDTVVQGTTMRFTYRIYNAGGITAKNFGYRLVSRWDNNTEEVIASGSVDSILAGSYKQFSSLYSTSLGNGRRTVLLTIDPDTTLREVYRDNNIYSFPFVVRKSSGNPLMPNLAIWKDAVTSSPQQITDETDTVRFTIIYGNTGSLLNDSISILVKHLYQSAPLHEYRLRRKYPVSYDTVWIDVPIEGKGGAHQLSVELDNTGLIVESSEADNRLEYFFTVTTTDFKILFPTGTSIAFVDRIIFLNPTAGAAVATPVTLQLDTLSSFPSPMVFNTTMQQFSTSVQLPALKRSQRYFWRVKITGGSRDWTTGSFFSGDSVRPAIGQIDSVGWSSNRFVRTLFRPDSGARIVDSRFTLSANSAGFSDGNTGALLVNGVNVITPILGSGHHVLVLDSVNYQPVSLRRFDLAADAAQADSLTQFIASVPNGRIVVDIVVDEGSNNLQPSTRTALKSIGSALIDQLNFRDSWSIIGRKGAAPGTVPEMRKAQGSGSAAAETTIIRQERTGVIETPLIGPFTSLGDLKLNSSVPPGSQLTVKFIGVSPEGTLDTLLTATNQVTIPLSSIDTRKYTNGKLLFQLTSSAPAVSFRSARRTAVTGSPAILGWSIAAASGTELALASGSSTIDRAQVMEGESITFSGTVYNVSATAADSVLVQLKSSTSGIDQVMKQQRYLRIAAGDSIIFTYVLNTRNRAGTHSFTFEIDPLDSLAEQTRENNSVSLPYVVIADSLRPSLQVTFDGLTMMNGDLVAARPEVRIRYTDNNPSSILPADTTNFLIKLNNRVVPFTEGNAVLIPSVTPGKAEVRWTPVFPGGENFISISAKDISGNGSDTLLLFLNTASDLGLLDVFNMPNPFSSSTMFTYTISAPEDPDEVTIRVYTVAGRMIRQVTVPGTLGFNKVPWDGRDNDGDEIGNGVYLYKVTVKLGEKQVEGISKLVKMR